MPEQISDYPRWTIKAPAKAYAATRIFHKQGSKAGGLSPKFTHPPRPAIPPVAGFLILSLRGGKG